jgi:hypothetical protein
LFDVHCIEHASLGRRGARHTRRDRLAALEATFNLCLGSACFRVHPWKTRPGQIHKHLRRRTRPTRVRPTPRAQAAGRHAVGRRTLVRNVITAATQLCFSVWLFHLPAVCNRPMLMAWTRTGPCMLLLVALSAPATHRIASRSRSCEAEARGREEVRPGRTCYWTCEPVRKFQV